MKRLAIIGAGELGQQILNLSFNNPEYQVVGFFDDTMKPGTTIISDYHTIGTCGDVVSSYRSGAFDCLLIGIGYKHLPERKKMYERFSPQIPFATIIHNSCIIDPTAKIGQGTVLYPGCIIDKKVIIKDNVLLNLGVVVSHDSWIDSHCFIAPRAVLSGFVKINECCFIGSGAILIDNIQVHPYIRIGAGTIVNRELTDQGVYVGNPARKIR